MNETTSFSASITQFISLALQLWPALQLSLANLHQCTSPPQGSPISHMKYSEMQPQQFVASMTQSLHDYILQHDVKVQHIMEYLDDILYILNAEQQNDRTMRCMAEELVGLIQDVPNGKYQRLHKIRFIYQSLKGKNIGHVVKVQQGEQQQQQQSHSNSDSDDEDSEGDDHHHDHHDHNDNQMKDQKSEHKQNKVAQEVPKLIGSQSNKQDNAQGDDDGWVVVKKKNKKH